MKDHAHAEPVVRPARHRPSDPSEPDEAKRLAGDFGPEQVSRAPPGPGAGAHVPFPLPGAPGDHQHQHDRVVGGVVGEDVGRVGDDQAAPFGRGDVDVIEPHAEVGQDPRPQRLHLQHLGGESVGHGRQQGVGARERGLQLGRGLDEIPEHEIALAQHMVRAGALRVSA